MKRNFLVVILFLSVWSATANGQNRPVFFTMEDSAFVPGSIFRTCRIIHDLNGHSTVRPESFPLLDSFVVFLKRHPEMIIEIGYYTDSRGSDKFNVLISEDRARYTFTYLAEHGISEKRLVKKGYGEANPIYTEAEILKETTKEKQEEMYSANRRAEFKIISTPEKFFRFDDSFFYVNEIYRSYSIKRNPNNVAILFPEGKLFLDSIALFMMAHPGLELEIGSFTDSRGSAVYNSSLSESHAKGIRDYLIRDGIDPKQLSSKGYGLSFPVVPDSVIKKSNDAENLYSQNRRVEFRIITVKKTFFTLTDSVFSPGMVLITYSVLFDLNKSTLRPEARLYLDTIAGFMKQHPQLVIEVGGHSDSRASKAYSYKLSQARAKSITDYLISKGIAAERLVAKGYEGDNPIYSDEIIKKETNKEKQERLYQLNRRTEFKILKVE